MILEIGCLPCAIDADRWESECATAFRDGAVFSSRPSAIEWRLQRTGQLFYAVKSVSFEGRRRTLSMHRLMAEAVAEDIVDHRDGNGLNNCMRNLRLCSHADNMRNRRSQGGTSRFRGVWWNHGRFYAGLKLNGRTIHLGSSKDEVSAARMYDRAAIEHYGEFARTNFPTTNITE
jgi:hypothetical protein